MFELKGKYNYCKVYTDIVDNATISQLTNLLNQECMSGLNIRIMSDCHAGSGCVVGTTMTLKDRVIPNLVGVDIGCGMRVIKLKEKRIDLPALDSVIRKYVPSGFGVHEEAIAESGADKLIASGTNIERAMKSLGTLGGGNHFIEVDRADDGSLYLVIHTGSRHLGIEVCKYYQDLAFQKLKEKDAGGSLREKSKDLVARYKAEGRKKEISKALEKLKAEHNATNVSVCHELAYVEGLDFLDYIHDMKITQEHAVINRATIAKQIMKHAKLHAEDEFETIHNYIDTDAMILRKGAVSAKAGEKLIIPLNMRDGALICIGKGNHDWNCSAPHGAGRIMSRSEAKENVSMSEYKKSMEGIFTTCVNRGTIDESPMAYKPAQAIIDNISETVEITDHIMPIYNFKASESE